jgi:hypothetical protein
MRANVADLLRNRLRPGWLELTHGGGLAQHGCSRDDGGLSVCGKCNSLVYVQCCIPAMGATCSFEEPPSLRHAAFVSELAVYKRFASVGAGCMAML